jgi:3-hydroxyisobutyrate dehydrogenase-like beta-hydroxyacid dehydrogenase
MRWLAAHTPYFSAAWRFCLQVASSPADVARQSDITFAMLADPAAAWEVAAGPDGVAAGNVWMALCKAL